MHSRLARVETFDYDEQGDFIPFRNRLNWLASLESTGT